MHWALPVNVQKVNLCSYSRISGVGITSRQTYVKHCALSNDFPSFWNAIRENLFCVRIISSIANTGGHSETPSPYRIISRRIV